MCTILGSSWNTSKYQDIIQRYRCKKTQTHTHTYTHARTHKQTWKCVVREARNSVIVNSSLQTYRLLSLTLRCSACTLYSFVDTSRSHYVQDVSRIQRARVYTPVPCRQPDDDSHEWGVTRRKSVECCIRCQTSNRSKYTTQVHMNPSTLIDNHAHY